MPFALLVIGMVLLASAIEGTQDCLLNLLIGDFSGPSNFTYWVLALLIIGSVGYVPKLKPFSDLFLVLVILVLVLARGNTSNPGGGFFQQFTTAIGTTNTGKGLNSTSGTVSNGLQTGSNVINSILGNG